ncbi:MAG: PQQ-binding-like beta-propeller repeat protein [Proteobacteria bacterium]|nr:PQQ-binding-like beta-propeller repeat protein [Pseudomonadota bacterium]
MLRHTLAVLLGLTLAGQAYAAPAANKDWPTYNRTLTSERFAGLDAINRTNVHGLKTLCTYDTGDHTGFQTDLLQVDGALFFTTEQDTFSIDPNTCKLNWRAHEDFPSGMLKVNRGVAWLAGRIYRGTADGRVLAYDAKTGKQVWSTTIADAKKGESVPAAPIAWNGLIFVGSAGGDNKGVKGRMYALDAGDGHVVWEFYMVPKAAGDPTRGPQAPGEPAVAAGSWQNTPGFPITGGGTWTSYTLDPKHGLLYVPGGNAAPDFVNEHRQGDNLFTASVVVLDAKTGAFRRHFQMVKRDFHDWDASTPPSLFTSKGGRRLLAEAPKDGHLHVIDLATGKQLYSNPVTRQFNVHTPLTAAGTRFCPGSQGGAEWNGAAYSPPDNLIFTGDVDWCTTVQVLPAEDLAKSPAGVPWSGAANGFGTQDDPKDWAGWITATDADSGAQKWQVKLPFPLMSGVTPTAGGLVFFGDMGGHLYAFNSATGKQLWSTDLGGAVAGGVITYDTGAGQRVAATAGMTSPIWPTPKISSKVVVLGL